NVLSPNACAAALVEGATGATGRGVPFTMLSNVEHHAKSQAVSMVARSAFGMRHETVAMKASRDGKPSCTICTNATIWRSEITTAAIEGNRRMVATKSARCRAAGTGHRV